MGDNTKEQVFEKLLSSFKELTVLDTNAFHKTLHWQRIRCTDLRQYTLDSETDSAAVPDELMSFNWDVVRTCYARAFHRASKKMEALG